MTSTSNINIVFPNIALHSMSELLRSFLWCTMSDSAMVSCIISVVSADMKDISKESNEGMFQVTFLVYHNVNSNGVTHSACVECVYHTISTVNLDCQI